MDSSRLKRADDRTNEEVDRQSVSAEPPAATEEEKDDQMADADGGTETPEPPLQQTHAPQRLS